MKSLQDCYTLSNGVKIPCIGFGTYLAHNGETAENAVKEAIAQGYRHIDTAAAYGNEQSIGKVIKECGVNRQELFITSKLWNTDQGYDSTLKAFDKTMSNLQLEYLDLYLIHWPVAKGHYDDWQVQNRETWRAFEKLYDEKRIRAIGVSNFKPHHIESLLKTAQAAPMVNQIELHPGYNQTETVEFCKKNDILIEAWGPFSQGKLFEHGELNAIAKKYNKTTAQVCLRWHLQKGYLPLPKSVTPSRIKENANIFDFEITRHDMENIDSITDIRTSHLDPDKAAF